MTVPPEPPELPVTVRPSQSYGFRTRPTPAGRVSSLEAGGGLSLPRTRLRAKFPGTGNFTVKFPPKMGLE